MAYIITKVENFDNKRNKVKLDSIGLAFLLYKGECKKLEISENSELSDEKYSKIKEEILLPRAKKRALYYMKNADKSRAQITRKLKEGLYPQEVIDKTLDFLDKYGFADDMRLADNYIEELKGVRSKREIEAKLAARGLRGEDIKAKLSELNGEDEYEAALKSLRKKYSRGFDAAERNKAYGYLARRGFSFDAIEHAVNAMLIDS